MRPLCLLVALALAVVIPLSTDAQDGKTPDLPAPEAFTCVTADGVKIVGDFYPPGRGRGQRAPCVILLHPVGPGKSSSSRKDFGAMPRRLQAEGLAVVAFDFRGYGESQTVDPARYWQEQPLGAKINKNATRIDGRDFRGIRDFAAMMNDLVAVKVWLNGKNNQKACDSHNVGLVGVEQAALIGLAWLVNEHQDANRRLDADSKVDRYEGEDVAAVFWLGMGDRLGAERVGMDQLQRWLTYLRDKKTQTLVVMSESDGNAKLLWDRAEKWIKPAKEKDREAFLQTKVRRVKGTPLVGLKLLEHDAFELAPEVAQFLDSTLSATNKRWSEHKGNKEPTPAAFRIP